MRAVVFGVEEVPFSTGIFFGFFPCFGGEQKRFVIVMCLEKIVVDGPTIVLQRIQVDEDFGAIGQNASRGFFRLTDDGGNTSSKLR